MSAPDLLLITWNRRQYVEKTIANVLANDEDFNLYCWDNDSQDGTADIIASINDPRVIKKNFATENVKQRTPTLWFFEQSNSDLVGKVDDDILLPHGWLSTIAPIVRSNANAGMLGCWIFMPEDWDDQLAQHKIIGLGDYRVFRNMWIAGQSFLAKKSVVTRYIKPENQGYGFPVDQYLMTVDGYVNGFPVPVLFAHNMDDPRSQHYKNKGATTLGDDTALTARVMGFANHEEYAHWIAGDAKNILCDPVSRQLGKERLQRDQSILGRARKKLARMMQSA